jgi:peptide-O-fucosyltransferase
MSSHHYHLQKYLQFNGLYQQRVASWRQQHFAPSHGRFIAVHLRINAAHGFHGMCHDDMTDYRKKTILKDYSFGQCNLAMNNLSRIHCLPSAVEVRQQLQELQRQIHDTLPIFIACDTSPMPQHYAHELKQFSIFQFQRNESNVIDDLAMMSMSDYFVGTCVSSFSSFVSRYRAISGAPTEFWGVSDHGEPPLTKETIGTSIDDHEL